MQRWTSSGKPDVSSPGEDEVCPRCRGQLPLDEQGEALPHRCCACWDDGIVKGGLPCPSCTLDLPAAEIYRRAGIPPVFASESIATWHPADGFQPRACERFIAAWPPEPWMLTLVGNTGTGKTHLAVGVLKSAWTLHRQSGVFVEGKRMLDAFRAAAGGEEGPTETWLMRWWAEAPILVIDELGFGRMTEYAHEQVYAIINARWSARRATVTTMNQEGWAALDGRVQSRLASGVTVEFRQDDRRVTG